MSIDSTLASQRRKGLRVALAVSLGFTASVASGALVPFLGPLFAAQFLLSSTAPMPFAKTLGMAILIFVIGMVMSILTSWFGDHPASFLLLLGLFYFCCFVAQSSGKGGAAISLVLIVGVIVPLLGILNKELGASILSILLLGVISGAVLMWFAHAVFPEPAVADELGQQAVNRPPDYGRALANSLILLSIMAICLTSDNLTSAAVIPITVITLLTQLDAAATGRAALGLAIVNLFGGIIASLAYEALALRPNLLSLFLITLVVCLFIGGRAAARAADARVYAGALTIFLILFGLGVSPLPGSAAESFSTRILYIGGAIFYTLLATALLWRPRPVETPAM
jgi:hypothetical protein